MPKGTSRMCGKCHNSISEWGWSRGYRNTFKAGTWLCGLCEAFNG